MVYVRIVPCVSDTELLVDARRTCDVAGATDRERFAAASL
jgi:hypothetical protein